MKNLGIALVSILFLFSCSSKELSKDSEYNDAISFILKNQGKEFAEIYETCEKILPEIVKRNDLRSYQKVIPVYNQNPNLFSKAMTLGFLASVETEDPILKDSIFAAVVRARNIIKSDAYYLSAQKYYSDKNYSQEELLDRLTSYKAMISDDFALMLIERQELTKAMNVYEEIIVDYKDTDILLKYSRILTKLNRYEASLMASIEALKMTPGSLEAKSEVRKTAELLGYSKVEISTMLEETIFMGRNLLRQNLLAAEVNLPMPEFSLSGLDGSILTNKDLKNKIAVVSFFATWCPPCKKELPLLNEFHYQHSKDEDLKIIAVSTDKDKYLVPPFVKKNAFDFPVYYGDGIQSQFGVKGIPTIFIVDQEGIIRYKKVGFTDGEEFLKIMSWYIEELKIEKEA